MARIEWIEQRLLNWARWKLANGADGNLGYSQVNLESVNGGRSGYVTASIPIAGVDASDTDAAINGLQPDTLAPAVHAFYVGRGGVDERARLAGCGVSTLKARVDQAHRKLQEYFIAQHGKRQHERDRVEVLQAGMRQTPPSFTP